jgi:hypothetical protein
MAGETLAGPVASKEVERQVRNMKRFGIALLLALVALSGVGTASAFNDDTPLTGPDSVQAP